MNGIKPKKLNVKRKSDLMTKYLYQYKQKVGKRIKWITMTELNQKQADETKTGLKKIYGSLRKAPYRVRKAK